MKIFELHHKLLSGAYLQGSREFHLPPVRCPVCGDLGAYSVNLPGVDPRKIGVKIPGKIVTPEIFADLKAKLQPFYPAGFTVQKCQGLGLLQASARGKLQDLVLFCGAGLCCFKAEALEKLNQSGIQPIQAFPVLFNKRSAWSGKIVEGQVHGTVSFGNSVHPSGKLIECPYCGGYNFKRLDTTKICINRNSIPKAGDFFAVKQWGTIHMVTERFKNAAESILANALFVEVTLVDE